MFTLGEAAKKVGKSKTTLTRAITAGRLSAKRLDDGSYQIDPAELFRVYDATPETVAQPINGEGRNPDSDPGREGQQATSDATVARLQAELEAADREKKLLSERIHELKQERDDWKAEADDWKSQSNNATLLLSHEQDHRKRGWLARLIG